MADRQHNEENISKRLASLIVTRSPSGREGIPEENSGDRDSGDPARGTQPAEQSDTRNVNQQG